MEKLEITHLIEEKHNQLIAWLKEQKEESWTKGPAGKWTTGQHALHLINSLKPLNKALGYPKFMLRYKFGKANRPVRNYDAIKNRYHERLQDAKGKTYKGSAPNVVPTLNDKTSIISSLDKQQKILQQKTLKLKDKHLDTLLLPHPLIGRMPIREIIMWSAHHAEHHLGTLKDKY